MLAEQKTIPALGHKWTDGVCENCGENCSHIWADGVCTNCKLVCQHNFENNVCTNCGLVQQISEVKGYNISLKDNIAVSFHIKLSDAALADENARVVFTLPNGKVVKAVDKGEYFEVKVEGILAQNLDSDCIVEVGNLTLNYNALSYGDLALKGSNTNLQNVVKALYAYNQAAKEYNG
ncbi:MAG: hypothetical protein IJF52_04490 [Clostridia bacterium]|nr:hypothetical protein [Clostridia bacterium]